MYVMNGNDGWNMYIHSISLYVSIYILYENQLIIRNCSDRWNELITLIYHTSPHFLAYE